MIHAIAYFTFWAFQMLCVGLVFAKPYAIRGIVRLVGE